MKKDKQEELLELQLEQQKRQKWVEQVLGFIVIGIIVWILAAIFIF